jgi:uncharacterized repeat protein (TIGR01451 family)
LQAVNDVGLERPTYDADDRMPRWWRMILVAICTLILCSCRVPLPSSSVSSAPDSPAPPRQAFTGTPAQADALRTSFNQEATATPSFSPEPTATVAPIGPPGWEMGIPLPYSPTGPWGPPGIAQPWPADEYLADGGDGGIRVAVGDSRQVRGLEMEDTVAHYDTLDGRTLVEPSNQVSLYSPRFRAVRQVVGVNESDQMLASSGVTQPVRLVGHADVATTGSTKQNVQTVRQIGEKSVTVMRTRQGDGAISTAIGLAAFDNGSKPYENLSVIRTGKFEAAERAWLARGTTAAITWISDQAVQVILDRQAASAVVRDQKTDTLYSVDEPPANPKLRIIKVASTPFAEVGDTVDFTLRFDNVGNQVIGNVVILDSLTTRLEFVPNSAQCSLPAAFSTQQNEGGSLVLRWEIAQPLEPERGGILRFTCRVR